MASETSCSAASRCCPIARISGRAATDCVELLGRGQARQVVERAGKLQRLVRRQRQRGAQRLVRDRGAAAGPNQPRARIREFHFRAQDVEPRRRSRLIPHLRKFEVALGYPNTFIRGLHALIGHQCGIEGFVYAKRHRLPRTLEVEPARLLRGRLRTVGMRQPAARIDRLRDVEAHDILANQVRAERLLRRAEDPGGNAQHRGRLRRCVKEVHVERRQECGPGLRNVRLTLAEAFACRLQILVAGQGKFQRSIDRERARARLAFDPRLFAANGRRNPGRRLVPGFGENRRHAQKRAQESQEQEDPSDARGGVNPRRHRCPPPGPYTFHSPFEEQVGNRHDDQRQERGREQAADRRNRDRRAEFAAFAGAERRRQHAEDHRHGRHHDRPQPDGPGLEERVLEGQPVAAYWFVRSTSRIAFFVTRPISITTPIIAGMPRFLPVSQKREQRADERERQRQHDEERLRGTTRTATPARCR